MQSQVSYDDAEYDWPDEEDKDQNVYVHQYDDDNSNDYLKSNVIYIIIIIYYFYS